MPNPRVKELRSAISDGLISLDRENGGRYLSHVANALGVDRSTVTRWKQARATASPAHCDALARRWPQHFDREHLANLQFRLAQLDLRVEGHHAGVDLVGGMSATYSAVADALELEPSRARDRSYRHVAFHLDRFGDDPVLADPHVEPGVREQIRRMQEATVRRARQGWTIQFVTAAGSLRRVETIERMVGELDGPNVEVFAYAVPLPLPLSPVVISEQTTVVARDHRRWGRPDASMVVHSRAVAEWMSRYIMDLAADAPFTLRRPAGPDPMELRRFRESVAKLGNAFIGEGDAADIGHQLGAAEDAFSASAKRASP